MEQGYCVKCKAKREMKDAHQVLSKKGQPMLKGECVVCGTKMCKIVAKRKKGGYDIANAADYNMAPASAHSIVAAGLHEDDGGDEGMSGGMHFGLPHLPMLHLGKGEQEEKQGGRRRRSRKSSRKHSRKSGRKHSRKHSRKGGKRHSRRSRHSRKGRGY